MMGDFYGDGNRYHGVESVAPSVLTITICDVCIISYPEGDDEE